MNQLPSIHNFPYPNPVKFRLHFHNVIMNSAVTVNMKSANPLEQRHGLVVLSVAELGLCQAVEELSVVFQIGLVVH